MPRSVARMIVLLCAVVAIIFVMAAGGDDTPAKPDTGLRGDFEPATHADARDLSVPGPTTWTLHTL